MLSFFENRLSFTLLEYVSESFWRGMASILRPTISRTLCEAPPSSVVLPAHDSSSSTSLSKRNTKNTNKEPVNVAATIVELTLTIGLSLAVSYLITKLTRSLMRDVLPGDDGANVPSSQIYRKLHKILSQRDNHQQQQKIAVPKLTSRELEMANEIVDPEEIESAFADIGGLDATKQEIYELAVLPLVKPELFDPNSKLIQPVKGMLLYGKPGTGKTMLAKALAKESCAIFLPLQLSKILNKYWGESNKLIAATFSLAHKLQPSVIFIDELDTFLKNTNSETAFMDAIKAEFLTLWDGVATSSASRVLVLGATNKPHHIDSAILRRMPRAFEVPLPDRNGRLSILKLLLQHEHVDDSALSCLPKLAAVTDCYSGSDLKELCRAAAMIPVQETTAVFARRRVAGIDDEIDNDDDEPFQPRIRRITENDLKMAMRKVPRTGAAAHQYGRHVKEEETQSNTQSINLEGLQNLMSLLEQLSSSNRTNSRQPSRESDDIPDLN